MPDSPLSSAIAIARVSSRAVVFAATLMFGSAFAQEEPPGEQKSLATLPEGAVARLSVSRGVHSDSVGMVAFSPDGKLVASVSADGRFYIWKWPSLEPVVEYQTRWGGVRRPAFASDSRRLVALSGFEPSKLEVANLPFSGFGAWEAQRGQNRRVSGFAGKSLRSLVRDAEGFRVIDEDKRAVVCPVEYPADALQSAKWCCATDDFRHVAIADGEGRVRVFDAESGKASGTIDTEGGNSRSMMLSPDAKRLSTRAASGVIQVWDVSTGDRVTDIRTDIRGGLTTAWSADGRLVATARSGGGVILWDAGTGLQTADFPTATRTTVGTIAFAPDSSVVLAGTIEGTLVAWDLATGKCRLPAPSDHPDSIRGASFSPDGVLLATCGQDGSVNIRDTSSGRIRETMSPGSEALVAIAWPPGSGAPVVISDENHIFRRTASGWTRTDLAGGPGNWASKIDFSAEGSLIAVSWDRGDLEVLRASSGESLASRAGTGSDDCNVALCSRWNLVAARRDDGSLDVCSGIRPQIRIPWRGQRFGPDALAFSPDGSELAVLATWSESSRVWVLDLASGRERCTVNLDASCGSLVWCDGGRAFAILAEEGEIVFCDASSGRETHRYAGETGQEVALIASPDGRLLATVARTGTGTIWRVPEDASLKADLEFTPGSLWKTLTTGSPEDAAMVTSRAQLSDAVVEFLRDRLQERPKPPDGLADLVSRLDDPDAGARDAAAQALREAGEIAEPFLRDALKESPSAEVAGRLREILTSFESLPVRSPAMLPRLRAIRMLQRAATPAARDVLARIAADSPYAVERIAAR